MALLKCKPDHVNLKPSDGFQSHSEQNPKFFQWPYRSCIVCISCPTDLPFSPLASSSSLIHLPGLSPPTPPPPKMSPWLVLSPFSGSWSTVPFSRQLPWLFHTTTLHPNSYHFLFPLALFSSLVLFKI